MRRGIVTTVLSGLLIYSVNSSAELYVSPIVRGSVDYTTSGKIEDGSFSLTGKSVEYGDFMMKTKTNQHGKTLKYGKNVPLFIAVENIIPDKSKWIIHFDEGIDNSVVSWEGGNSWEGVLKTIGLQNDLSLIINHEEMAIGVSPNVHLARHLAKKIPNVWYLKANLSLKQNLEKWSKKAGWTLSWDHNLKIDYPIINNTVLTGKFAGKGGVVDQVVSSFAGAEIPLSGVFYMKNNVCHITYAGYKQEIEF